MVKMTKLRSVWVRGTGMSLIYEASGAKMGSNALYFTPITDTFNTLPILAEVSFQLKLQSTNLHKIFNKKKREKDSTWAWLMVPYKYIPTIAMFKLLHTTYNLNF